MRLLACCSLNTLCREEQSFHLEHSLIKVPTACLNNVFRSYNALVQREVVNVIHIVSDLNTKETLTK